MKGRSGRPSAIRPSVGRSLTVLTSTRWIFCFGDLPCKENVHRTKPDILEELRLYVEQYVQKVSADTAERVGLSFIERGQMYRQRGGAQCPLRARSQIKNVQIVLF